MKQLTEEQQKRFEDAEKEMKDIESAIADTRTFIAKHGKALAQFGWNILPVHRQIMFYEFHDENKDPKAIARAFGADGWKREKDSYTCGALHWNKTVDGIKLLISNAEKVDFKPLEAVRL